MIGFIKYFNTAKGYGFIGSHSLKDHIFVHIYDVMLPDRASLQLNDEVTFELQEGQDGRPRAKGVRRIAPSAKTNTPSEDAQPADPNAPYMQPAGRPRRYFRADMQATEFDRERHIRNVEESRISAERLFDWNK